MLDQNTHRLPEELAGPKVQEQGGLQPAGEARCSAVQEQRSSAPDQQAALEVYPLLACKFEQLFLLPKLHVPQLLFLFSLHGLHAFG